MLSALVTSFNIQRQKLPIVDILVQFNPIQCSNSQRFSFGSRSILQMTKHDLVQHEFILS